MAIRITILDDHPIMIAGIMQMLQSHTSISILDSYAWESELMMALEGMPPEVLIVICRDIGEFTRLRKTLQRHYSQVRLLCMISAGQLCLLRNEINELDIGYILQSANQSTLIEAIEKLHQNGRYVDPELLSMLYGCKRLILPSLTKRENEILQLICEGFTAQEIADRLHISLRTVENHRGNLLVKMSVNNTARLVRVAVETGMVA